MVNNASEQSSQSFQSFDESSNPTLPKSTTAVSSSSDSQNQPHTADSLHPPTQPHSPNHLHHSIDDIAPRPFVTAEYPQLDKGMSKTPLGIIAGNGRLPFLFALAARERGHSVIALALKGEADPTLASCVDKLIWISVGQPAKAVALLKECGVNELVFAGGVGKLNLLRHTRFDLGALKILASMKSKNDDCMLRTIARYFEDKGIKVCAPTDILSEVVAPVGMLTEGALTSSQEQDVEMGIQVAELLGRADVGQTVVVKDGSVIAVEASEGTDACIRRAAQLAGPGIVVVKRCKPTQDRRFDLPTIGPKTIQVIAELKGAVLAIQAKRTIVIDAPQVLADAEKASIAIVAKV